VQNVDYPTCPCCQKKMQFIMQLDSTDTLPFWFGDYGCAYVFQCENHPDVMTMTWSSRA